ncbi:hypothetical protein KDW_32070 [Dictyobacter vulcani]|uniref:Uncharacterized protein n=1 Tax=Dictyobacter vulcani TaxID=2607529 RepID=A0A5J4KMD6_9CHLR|nr:hypothetical protein [Dictyobacter vulcani]GER89045.1 hypothetical protein KDW_32070 [Dictyobacter vulcani]
MHNNDMTALQQARQALEQGNPQEAFQIFHPILSYSGKTWERSDFVETWSVFAEISAILAGEEFTKFVHAVVRHPEDVQALYNVGYQLFEQGLPDLAATALARAHALDPDSADVLNELVSALETMGMNAEACRLLQARPEVVQHNYLSRYLLAFNAIMSRDLETPRNLLASLQQGSYEHREELAGRIASMLARADAIKDVSSLDQQDLRGWHYVLTGAFLLHLSPYGFDEGMNGRYAFVQDTRDLCLEGILRLVAALKEMDISVPRIFALPERGSTILAQALALKLHVPLVYWSDEGHTEPGLIAAYDLSLLDGPTLVSLRQHHPGQVLWSHATCWTESFPFTADVTTFLYQVNHAPWESQMRVNPETKQVENTQPDEHDAAIIAAGLLQTQVNNEALEDVPKLQALVKTAATTHGAVLPAALSTQGRRQQLWIAHPSRVHVSHRFLPWEDVSLLAIRQGGAQQHILALVV